MKIAAGGIATESATFSPLLTEFDDFTIVSPDELHEYYDFATASDDVTLVPLFFAWAVPGGPIRRAAYQRIKQDFMEQLRAGAPWDGVYLDMHGAMFVDGMTDAEADWTAAVREIVGPDCPISVSYDLHGNVSQGVIDQVDLLTAYRTAPHEDGPQTRARAFHLLVNCLRTGVRPHMAFVPIPLLLSGERTMTLVEPGKSVYGQIENIIDGASVVDASLLVGYTWADEARSHASALAIGPDEAAVEAAAKQLAQAYWDARHDFQFGMITASVDESIQMALDSPEDCVFISDSGDNVTGGGVGDVPVMLERLLAHNAPKTVVASIADAGAVLGCFAAGVGATIALKLGGKLDPIHGQPLTVMGIVKALHTPEPGNRHAILRTGNIDVILTEQRTAFTTLAQFTDLNLEPLTYKIVCIKVGYLYPDLQPIAPKAILALSPGAINAIVEELPFKHIRRPIFPFDPDMNWTP